MQSDAPALLWDALQAATMIRQFVTGRDWDGYATDSMLRSAVERQFEIIGEAFGRLRRIDPDVADRIADLPRIVAFRNVLIHGYASIDDAIVWEVATSRVVPLIAALTDLLHDTST